MERLTLSRKDELALLEIGRDRNTAKLVFHVAMENYHNLLNSIAETEKILWDHLTDAYNLDPTKEWQVEMSKLNRRFELTEKK